MEFWDTFSYLKIIELSVLPSTIDWTVPLLQYGVTAVLLPRILCLQDVSSSQTKKDRKVHMSHPKESRTLKFWSPSTVHLNPRDSHWIHMKIEPSVTILTERSCVDVARSSGLGIPKCWGTYIYIIYMTLYIYITIYIYTLIYIIIYYLWHAERKTTTLYNSSISWRIR